MVRQMDENDWVLFKTRMPLWRERHLEKLLNRYEEIIEGDESAEERFYTLQKRIDKDSWCALFSVEMSRSKVLINLMRLLNERIITIEDLDGFTPGLRENVMAFMKSADSR